jgi:hypothetical protein
MFILGVLALLIAGFVRVLHDLLEQGPHAAPSIEDEGLVPLREGLVPLQSSPSPNPALAERRTASGWNRERYPH